MKTIYENQFTCTKDYYREYYKYICFKRPIVVSINIILCISFVIAILSIVLPETIILEANTAGTNIATVLIVLFLQIYLFFRNINLAYSRDLEKNKGNPIEVKVSITEDSVNISRSFQNNISIEFANVVKVIKTKKYYTLVTKAELTIALKKDGFIIGTAEQFESFLKQKGIK